MKADLSYLDHKWRAKRTGQSPVEYAAAIQGYRRPASWKSRALALLAVGLVLATLALSFKVI